MKNYLSPSSVLRQAHVGFYALLLFFLIGVGNAYAQSSVVPQGGLAFYKADFELNEKCKKTFPGGTHYWNNYP